MSLIDLLQELQAQGIVLSMVGDRIHVRSPGGVNRKEIEKIIRERKLELIQALKRHEPSPSSEVVHILESEKILEMGLFIRDLKPRWIFLDTETTGLDPFKDSLQLIQVKAGEKVFLIHVAEIHARETGSSAWDGLRSILEDEQLLKVGHNLKFDVKFLSRFFSSKAPGIRIRNLYDTFIAESLLTAGIETDRSLKGLAKKYLHIDLDKTEQKSFQGGPLTREQVDYAVQDVTVLEKIFPKQAQGLSGAGLVDVAKIEFSIISAVAGMELSGMGICLERLSSMREKMLMDLRSLEDELNGIVRSIPMAGQQNMFGARINLRSPAQVKSVLERLGFSIESTAIGTLLGISHPFARMLVQHRRLSKLLSSFVDKLPRHIHPVTGRIHADFFQVGSNAGRFTCSNPNLQQIPHTREWRDLFIARPGYKIITADYSQIELRILAEYSQDPAFLEAYRTGQDLHKRTASDVFHVPIDAVTKEQRTMTKSVNFGLAYGMSAVGLSYRLNISVNEAEAFIHRYFRAYPKVKECLQRLGIRATRNLYTQTLSGRKRYFNRPSSLGAQKSLERKGRNTPIQGTSADITKKALSYLTDSLLPYDCRIINCVHDEIVFEANENAVHPICSIIRRDMIRAGEDFIKSIPIEIDIVVDDVWRK